MKTGVLFFSIGGVLFFSQSKLGTTLPNTRDSLGVAHRRVYSGRRLGPGRPGQDSDAAPLTGEDGRVNGCDEVASLGSEFLHGGRK